MLKFEGDKYSSRNLEQHISAVKEIVDPDTSIFNHAIRFTTGFDLIDPLIPDLTWINYKICDYEITSYTNIISITYWSYKNVKFICTAITEHEFNIACSLWSI